MYGLELSVEANRAYNSTQPTPIPTAESAWNFVQPISTMATYYIRPGVPDYVRDQSLLVLVPVPSTYDVTLLMILSTNTNGTITFDYLFLFSVSVPTLLGCGLYELTHIRMQGYPTRGGWKEVIKSHVQALNSAEFCFHVRHRDA